MSLTKAGLIILLPLARWFPSSCGRTSESTRTKQASAHREVFNIRQFLLDQRKEMELAEGIGIEDDMEDVGNKEITLLSYQQGIHLNTV